MSGVVFERAVFVKSAVAWGGLPTDGQPEVALVGRSNAGKSSALNVLANRTRLAYVSKTPGRTQALNYYQLPHGGYVVDLPGYGYAKTARATKTDWGPLLGRYIVERVPLRGVVMLMDIRHTLVDHDRAFLQWYAPANRELLILLTKCDKISKQAQTLTLKKVLAELAQLDPALAARTRVMPFSSPKKTGVDEAGAVIREWLPEKADNVIAAS